MTRETAKILAQLTDDQLAEISCGFKNHAKCLRAYADGAKIEVLSGRGDWREQTEPAFLSSWAYRVMPPASRFTAQKLRNIARDLEAHDKWRRGHTDRMPHTPKQLGLALRDAIDALREYAAAKEERRP